MSELPSSSLQYFAHCPNRDGESSRVVDVISRCIQRFRYQQLRIKLFANSLWEGLENVRIHGLCLQVDGCRVKLEGDTVVLCDELKKVISPDVQEILVAKDGIVQLPLEDDVFRDVPDPLQSFSSAAYIDSDIAHVIFGSETARPFPLEERENVPDPTAEKNQDKPCGRGMHIMKACADDVKYFKGGRFVHITLFNNQENGRRKLQKLLMSRQDFDPL